MPRLDRVPQVNRNTLLTFPSQVNDTTPFVAPTKPLSASRLTIVITAGLHRRGDRLFVPGDQTYRVIEGHMAMKPTAGGDEIARWFWAETAMGQLVRRVRDRLDASDDPRRKAAAFGIAR
jgi:hypothetical protein